MPVVSTVEAALLPMDQLRSHYDALPENVEWCELWHSHEPEDIRRGWINPRHLATRFTEAVGYAPPNLPVRYDMKKPYIVNWLPIPDSIYSKQAVSTVFNHFNLTTSLNVYPKAYFAWWMEVIEAQDQLYQLKRRFGKVLTDEIKELEAREDLLRSQRPADCFFDLAIDIDSSPTSDAKTLHDAQAVAIRIAEHLEHQSIPHQVYFSGSKGFHLMVDHRCFGQNLATNNHTIVEGMVKKLTEHLSGIGYDNKIYSSRRQLRLANTRHPKSGLFKTYLSPQLLTGKLSDILDSARYQNDVPAVNTIFNDALAQIYSEQHYLVNHRPRYDVKPVHRHKLQAIRQSQSQDLGETVVPAMPISELQLPPCMQEAVTLGIKDSAKANRNQVTLLMAQFFREIGRSESETVEYLRAHALEKLAPFSSSNSTQIIASTNGAVKTVFRDDKYSSYNCNYARKLGFSCTDRCEWYRSQQEHASSRKLQTVDAIIPSIDDSAPAMTIDEIRVDMMQVISEYILEPREDGKRVIPLHVRVVPGLGKTTGLIRWLSDHPELHVLWVGSYHKLFANIPEALRDRWRQIMGRHGTIYPSDAPIIPPNCTQVNLAKIYRDKRLNFAVCVCSRCDDKKSCQYNAQFLDSELNWFVMQPMFLHKVRDYLGKFDVLVIDEEILGAFIETIEVRQTDVHHLANLLNDFNESLFSFELNEDIEVNRSILTILSGVERVLASSFSTEPLLGNILHRIIDEQCRIVQQEQGESPCSFVELLQKIGKDKYDFVPKLINPFLDPDELPFNFGKELLEILEYETNSEHAASNLSRLKVSGYFNHEKKWVGRLSIYQKLPAPSFKLPTILLDATGDAILNETLLETPIRVYEPPYRLTNPVLQIYSTTGSKASLRNSSLRKRMITGLQKLVAEEPKTLVICKQLFVEEVKQALPPSAEVIHYFGNRGSNEYGEFRQVVLFGKPGLPLEEILLFAGALFYDQPLSTEQQDIQRTFPGTSKSISVRCFVEPQLQAIAEAFREVEMIQAAHRIRGLHDSTKRIVIMSGIVLKDFYPTELMTLSQLLGISPKCNRKEVLQVLVESQLEHWGFVIPAITLAPFFIEGLQPTDSLLEWYEQQELGESVGTVEKVSQRTFEGDFKNVCQGLSLVACQLSLTGKTGGRPAVAWIQQGASVTNEEILKVLDSISSPQTFQVVGSMRGEVSAKVVSKENKSIIETTSALTSSVDKSLVNVDDFSSRKI